MPALIKANSTLLAGNAQLTSFNVATASDGGLSINAEFVVLSQFASAVYSSFKIGSDLHQSLKTKAEVISALQNYNSQKLPTLTSVEIVTASGLCTISVSYSAETLDTAGTNADGSPKITSEITTNTDLRSLSGSVAFFSGTDNEEAAGFSFDYYATSVTAENQIPLPVNPSDIFNVRSPIKPQAYITTQPIFSNRTYRNNLGQYKTTNTVTVVYVQNRFTG